MDDAILGGKGRFSYRNSSNNSVGSHDRDENGDRWKQLVYKAPVTRGHLIESVDISDFTDNVSIAMRNGNLLSNLVYIFIFSLQ